MNESPHQPHPFISLVGFPFKAALMLISSIEKPHWMGERGTPSLISPYFLPFPQEQRVGDLWDSMETDVSSFSNDLL